MGYFVRLLIGSKRSVASIRCLHLRLWTLPPQSTRDPQCDVACRSAKGCLGYRHNSRSASGKLRPRAGNRISYPYTEACQASKGDWSAIGHANLPVGLLPSRRRTRAGHTRGAKGQRQEAFFANNFFLSRVSSVILLVGAGWPQDASVR